MVQPVLRDEADSRKHDSVFVERQAELNESASKMPKGVSGVFPYLMEINTGHIHPWSKALADRSDLVVGCYDLSGSFDPADADPHYDPQGVYAANERRGRIETVAPQTAAERKAADAAAKKKLREEIEAEIRLEMEAKYGPALVESEVVDAPPAVVTAPPATAKTTKGSRKPATAQPTSAAVTEVVAPAEPVVVVAPEPEQVANPNIMDAFGGGSDDLDAAFEDAMRG